MLSASAKESLALKELKQELLTARETNNETLIHVLKRELLTEENLLQSMDTGSDEQATLLEEHKALGSAKTTLGNGSNARHLKDA